MRSKRSVALRGAPRSTSAMTSRALRSTAARGQVVAAAGHHDMSACARRRPARRRRASTPIRTGFCSRTNGLMPAQLLPPSRATATDHDDRASGHLGGGAAVRRGRAGAGPARAGGTRCVLWVKLSSWAARPLRALPISERTTSSVELAGGRDQGLAGVDHSPVDPDLGAVLEPVEDLRRRRCRRRARPPRRAVGTEVRDSGPRSSVPALTTATTPASTRDCAVSRSMSWWSMTATSPAAGGPAARRTPMDARGAVDAGEGGGWTGADCELHDRAMVSAVPLPFREARPLGRGGVEQLAGVRAGAVGVLDAGQHPGELLLPARPRRA